MYKSKLSLLIKMEMEKLTAIQETVAFLTADKNQLMNQIEQEESEEWFGFVQSKLGETLPSSFFGGTTSGFRMERLKAKVRDLEGQIEAQMKEYQFIKKKKERLEEENKKREKEYEGELYKKEMQKIEELFAIKRQKGERGHQ